MMKLAKAAKPIFNLCPLWQKNVHPQVTKKIISSVVCKRYCSTNNDNFYDDDDNDFEIAPRKNFQKNFNKSYNQRNSNRYLDDNDDDYDEHFSKNNFHPNRRSNFRRNNYQNQYNNFNERNFNNSNDYGNFHNFNNNDRYNSFRRDNQFSSRKYANINEREINLPKISWNDVELKEVKKNCYTPSEAVLNRSEEEIEKFRHHKQIILHGENIPNPILQFSDYEFPEEFSKALNKMGFSVPMAIQAQSWPIAMSGRDMIGIGQTGSGKTLGYILPAMIHILNQDPVLKTEGPICLVLAPTRELVQQIYSVATNLSRYTQLRAACAYGGENKSRQISNITYGPSVVIAAPGRLIDFLEMGATNLKRCSYLVLDEADRMLDMGFEPQIRQILEQARPDRQTLMFSATWPKEIQALARQFLSKDHIQLNIGNVDLFANPDIQQQFDVCPIFDKLDKLLQFLKMEQRNTGSKILIFAETRMQVDNLARQIRGAGINVEGTHGGLSQLRRNRALRDFKFGKANVLIATDVASRGLDVDDISVVVNFSMPTNIEDYIHRIGRTGRAGKQGRSLSYVTSRDISIIPDLIEMLHDVKQEVPEDLLNLSNESKFQRKMKKYR